MTALCSKKASLVGVVTKANIALDAQIIKKTLVYKSKNYINVGYKLGLKALKMNDFDLRRRFKQIVKVVMESLRHVALISCFGSSYNSILMWSHYANKHKGACLEFEIDDKNFKKVSYRDKFPSFRLTDSLEILFGHDFGGQDTIDTNNPDYYFMLEPILCKSELWMYEGEIRCVYSKSNYDNNMYEIKDEEGKKVLLKMPKIKKIYVGCNANDDFLEAIKEKAVDIPVCKMKIMSGEYGLEVEQNE